MKSGRFDIEKMLSLWLEGRLDADQAEQLMSLLDKNPDLCPEFSFLSFLKLKPPRLSYSQKDKLKKSPSDISDSQFEYLSVAALENDLPDQGKKELEEIIEKNQSRKKIYESIKRTKLTVPVYNYPYKNRLRKLTVPQKVLRISIAAISTAAAIALLVIYLKPSLLQQTNNIASNVQNTSVTDTLIMYSARLLFKSAPTFENGVRKEEVKTGMTEIPLSSPLLSAESSETDAEEISDMDFNADFNIEPVFAGIDYLRIPELVEKRYNYFILAGFPERLKPPVFEKNRSNVDRFVAKLIHNKILKDTLSVDKPVKVYDIAQAGVVSINKLLGWDMALVRTSDKEGEPNSVYFSSALLKFNVPVKKTNQDE